MSMPTPRHGDAEATCPWCGHKHTNSWDWNEGQHECHECEKPFDVDKVISVEFNTRPMAKCSACGLLCPTGIGGLIRSHSRGYEPCEGSRQPPTNEE